MLFSSGKEKKEKKTNKNNDVIIGGEAGKRNTLAHHGS